LAFDGPADAALASLSALRWDPCRHHAGIIVSIALSLLLVPHQRGCPCCADIITLIALALSPLLHPHCRQHPELAFAQSQCSRNTLALVVLLPCSLLLLVALLLYPVLFHGNLAFSLKSYSKNAEAVLRCNGELTRFVSFYSRSNFPGLLTVL
jgi:hypothetical protein